MKFFTCHAIKIHVFLASTLSSHQFINFQMTNDLDLNDNEVLFISHKFLSIAQKSIYVHVNEIKYTRLEICIFLKVTLFFGKN